MVTCSEGRGSRLSTEGLISICVTGMIKWGQKSKTQKNPKGFQQNPKKSHGEFLSLENFRKQNQFGCTCTLFAELCSWDTQNYRKSSDCFE